MLDSGQVRAGKGGLRAGPGAWRGFLRIEQRTSLVGAGGLNFVSALVSWARTGSLISLVPGGVGRMTITMLLHNTIISAERWVGMISHC